MLRGPGMTPEKKEEEEAGSGRASSLSASSSSSSASPSAPEGPPRGGLELAEARRRLLEAESRRALVSELERRVHCLHRVFLEAELRLAARAEGLGRLAGGTAHAELRLAASASGQGLLRRLPRLRRRLRPKKGPPAAFLVLLRGCAPFALGRGARGPPESPFRAPQQGPRG